MISTCAGWLVRPFREATSYRCILFHHLLLQWDVKNGRSSRAKASAPRRATVRWHGSIYRYLFPVPHPMISHLAQAARLSFAACDKAIVSASVVGQSLLCCRWPRSPAAFQRALISLTHTCPGPSRDDRPTSDIPSCYTTLPSVCPSMHGCGNARLARVLCPTWAYSLSLR